MFHSIFQNNLYWSQKYNLHKTKQNKNWWELFLICLEEKKEYVVNKKFDVFCTRVMRIFQVLVY